MLRASYLADKVTEMEVLAIYMRNKEEADGYEFFGLSVFDLMLEEKRTHNPLLRAKLNEAILQHNEKSRNSKKQNELSLAKLEYYRKTALGIGIRPVMNALRVHAKAGDI